jgi:5'-3' exoribonuclease 2
VFAYYYKGCESWDWYYPFHYAPFASDLIDCAKVDIQFTIGQPRRPFEQLMCVFPKQSAHALPKCYHWLMSDSRSPIIDFYPTTFRLDVNGAAYAWMGVNLLPFID